MSRHLTIPDAAQRNDLAAFVERALRLDDAAVIRLRRRSDGLVAAWVGTGLDVLAVRAVAGEVSPDDISCGADQLARGLRSAATDGRVDTGFPMDSAWRGVLPPENGFTHLDDVPAAVLVDLAHRGADLAREQGSARPARLAAGPGRSAGQRGRCRGGRADALCVRFDRNGFRARSAFGR